MCRHVSLFFIVICLLFAIGMPATAQEAIAQHNKEIYRDALAQASSGNWQVLFDTFADTYMSNQGGITLQESSREAVEVFGNALAAAVPDMQITPDVMIAQGDWLVVSMTYSGTFSQPFNFPPIPVPVQPTNQTVQWTEMGFIRFNDEGKIVENWSVSNPRGMLTQLGLIPPQESGAPPLANPLTDPVGYKALSADELAATFTSGSEERNTAAAEASIQDLTDVDPVYADPYILRIQDVGISETHTGDSSAGSDFIGLLFAAMPDIKATPIVVVAEGDWVARLLTFSGTFSNEISMGPNMTLTPTGQEISWNLGFIDRFNTEGKIVEEWNADDPTPLLQGLGLIPSPNATSEAGS